MPAVTAVFTSTAAAREAALALEGRGFDDVRVETMVDAMHEMDLWSHPPYPIAFTGVGDADAGILAGTDSPVRGAVFSQPPGGVNQGGYKARVIVMAEPGREEAARKILEEHEGHPLP